MDNSVQPLYEDIDLRPYIENLIRQWRIVIAVPVITALVTLGIASLLPVSYESTALVAVTNPRFQLLSNNSDFDPATPFKAYPELATSDDLVAELYDQVAADLPADFRSRLDLQKALTAVNGSDPSLIRLTVEMNDAEAAARVTNVWAALFVKRANFVFGNQGEDAFAFFQVQLAEAKGKMEEAEGALVTFQGNNRQVSLTNELAVLSETQTAYQRDLREIRAILEEVRFLQGQIALADTSTTADALAGLILQSKALNIENNIPAGRDALQIQLTADALTTSIDSQTTLMQNLEAMLIGKESSIQAELSKIEGEMLTRQSSLQALVGERERLEDEREIASETYASLARKVEETRISSQDIAAQVQLASEAAVPLEPAGISPTMQAILAAMVVFMGSVGISFLSQWWMQGRAS